jgi:hypothetical protein
MGIKQDERQSWDVGENKKEVEKVCSAMRLELQKKVGRREK